jgi:hypothetical protein
VLYLYAITDASRPPGPPGLAGAPLRAIGDGELFAIVSDHEAIEVEVGEEDLWTHEAVLEALMRAATVLPLRFGSVLADDEAVLATLHERRHELGAALERVAGSVELGVRALVPEPAAPAESEPAEPVGGAGGPGTAYMQARLERRRRAADLGARIHEPLAELARESVPRAGRAGGSFNVAYLVVRGQVGEFAARVERLAAEIEDATVVCTGPWPPYSFVSPEGAR